MEVRAEVDAVVPTLGGPTLGAALSSLREQGAAIEITVVHQGAPGGGDGALAGALAGLAHRVLTFPTPLGFAAAANAGIAHCRRRYLLLLNDDAALQPGWLAAARAALDSAPNLAAVQGVNLLPGAGEARVEGCGLAWNRWWQAVQLGLGGPAPPAGGPREVFGASAAAVLYRASALAAVALPGGVAFDARLHTYYEDVELAGRLRGAGWLAALAPAAQAVHHGGASGAALGRRRLALLYGNRWLALARLLGGALPGRLPRILLRDLLDAARAPRRLPPVVAGWARARRGWRHFARSGPPLVPRAELRRLAAERSAG